MRAVRARSWVLLAAAGATFGVSVLVRPVALYIWILLIPLVWLLSSPKVWRRRLINSGIVMLAFLVPVGGWIVRNERTTGVAVLSTIEARDLLRFRAANALAFDRGIPIKNARVELVDKVNRDTKGENAAERSRTEMSEAVRTILAHPIGTAVTSVRGFARLLIGPGRAELFRVIGLEHPNRVGGVRTLVFALEAALLLALLVGAACGTVLSITRRKMARARGRRWVRGLPRRDLEQRRCVLPLSRAGRAIPRAPRRLRRRLAHDEHQSGSPEAIRTDSMSRSGGAPARGWLWMHDPVPHDAERR